MNWKTEYFISETVRKAYDLCAEVCDSVPEEQFIQDTLELLSAHPGDYRADEYIECSNLSKQLQECRSMEPGALEAIIREELEKIVTELK